MTGRLQREAEKSASFCFWEKNGIAAEEEKGKAPESGA